MREVACWRSKRFAPDQVAAKAMCLGYHYNIAMLGAENEKWGAFVNYHMMEQGYPNLYVRVRYGRVQKNGQRDMLGTEVGWQTNSRTRDYMFATGMRVVNEQVCQINSSNQLTEMREIFRDDMGKPCHPKSGNDDEVMAWLGCLMFREAAYNRNVVVNEPKPPQTDAEREEALVTDIVREHSRVDLDRDDETLWMEPWT